MSRAFICWQVSVMHVTCCVHSFAHSLTHSVTYSLTHPLTHSLSHPLTHSLTHPPNQLLTLTHLPHSLTHYFPAVSAGNPYADEHGAFGDNVFRYTLLSMAACEAPLVLPIGGYRSAFHPFAACPVLLLHVAGRQCTAMWHLLLGSTAVKHNSLLFCFTNRAGMCLSIVAVCSCFFRPVT